MVNTNIQWLKEFAARHPYIPLMESFSPKWFAFKKDRMIFNPKQAAIAGNMEFKLYVLEICYNNIKSFTSAKNKWLLLGITENENEYEKQV